MRVPVVSVMGRPRSGGSEMITVWIKMNATTSIRVRGLPKIKRPPQESTLITKRLW
jgi:hypothetical protein